ncbi:hypothetical protein LAW65_00535 [Escherichia coli]|nr:hypothetical protein [Escherichia coli]MCQ6678008.1 hypothetical protein [Escherichia coli]MDD8479829.1 hypothetical protein [Escherichia coli]
MDGLTFLASITQSLAWPLIVGAVLYYGRDDIVKIIKTLKSIKYNDFEMLFEKKIAQTAEVAENKVGANASYTGKYDEFAFLNARQTIKISFDKLEAALRNALSTKISNNLIKDTNVLNARGRLQDNLPVEIILSVLNKHGFIDDSFQDVFNKLRSLKDAIANWSEFEITNEAAKNYADSAIILIDKLKSI